MPIHKDDKHKSNAGQKKKVSDKYQKAHLMLTIERSCAEIDFLFIPQSCKHLEEAITNKFSSNRINCKFN